MKYPTIASPGETYAMISAGSPDRLADEERRALDVYDRSVRPSLRAQDEGKYVAVAYETGDYEIDADDYAATSRLLARRPGARVWLMRAGQEAAYRMRRSGPDGA